MAASDIVEAILHYKRNIDKISTPVARALKYEDRLLHCIEKLYKLPVKVNHLQTTGVGRTVNSLRKIEGEKGLADAAKALVAKWKNMVILEEEAERREEEESRSYSPDDDLARLKAMRQNTQYNDIDDGDDNVDNDDHDDDYDELVKTMNGSSSRKRHGESNGRKNTSDSDQIEEEVPKKRSKAEREHHKTSSSSASSSHTKDSTSKRHSFSKNSSGSKHSHINKNSRKIESKAKALETCDNGLDSQSGGSFADALLGSSLPKKSLKKKQTSSNYTRISPGSSDHSSDASSSAMKSQKSQLKEVLSPTSLSDLEPLDADLVCTLPTTVPYYKPMPTYIPTPQDLTRRKVVSEEDALSSIMYNKNQRTKVYSGVKGSLTFVPSLYEFCLRVLQQNFDMLEFTGGIPYSIFKGILASVSPSQLYRFETYNPYILEDTDELWEFHVKKLFRNETRQEFESWRDMYLRCVDEREARYKAVKANIRKTIDSSEPARKAKLAYVDVAKPPRNILKKQIKNGTSKPDINRLLGKTDPEAVRVPPPPRPHMRNIPEPALLKMKPKMAPLMQKTLKSIKMTRFKR